MSLFLKIDSESPQLHLVRQAAQVLLKNGVIIYPTGSAYALGCRLGNKLGIQRIRQIRALKDQDCLTLLCRDTLEMSRFADVQSSAFHLIEENTPGPYTFLLPLRIRMPGYLVNTKGKTIGVSIPDHKLIQVLLEMIDEPIVSTALILPGSIWPLLEPEAMRDLLGKRVDLVIDGGSGSLELNTVIDLVCRD